ncbi:hypothetical protein MJL22_26660, partial [Salmonella enterica subsp. enterica serovar Montevideo]|nr:hypothetical protein [Salmonella enterica subsp. enterica serovar Montevideo]
RYFIKADKHGVGAAYYLPWWCAQTAATLSQGWIDNVVTQWTILPKRAGHKASLMSMTPTLNRGLQRYIADSNSSLLGLQPEDWL